MKLSVSFCKAHTYPGTHTGTWSDFPGERFFLLPFSTSHGGSTSHAVSRRRHRQACSKREREKRERAFFLSLSRGKESAEKFFATCHVRCSGSCSSLSLPPSCRERERERERKGEQRAFFIQRCWRTFPTGSRADAALFLTLWRRGLHLNNRFEGNGKRAAATDAARERKERISRKEYTARLGIHMRQGSLSREAGGKEWRGKSRDRTAAHVSSSLTLCL